MRNVPSRSDDKPPRYLRCKEQDDTLVLYVTVENLSEVEVRAFGTALLWYGERAARSFKRIILDFRKVKFMSSAVIGMLVLFHRFAVEHDVAWRLRCLNPGIRKVFKITRLDKVFPICRANDPDPFRRMRFEPDLFEVRIDVLETLQGKGFDWMVDFHSVDLIHEHFGIEVTGIPRQQQASLILEILTRMYPKWHPG